MSRECLSLAILLSVCFVGTARADVIPEPPEVFACLSLTAGSPCSNNGPGTCQNATCTTGASSSGYSCLKCVPADSSGCAMGGRLARTVGPWLAAGLFGAAVMLARRRPRR
jgi:hypothetical protein